MAVHGNPNITDGAVHCKQTVILGLSYEITHLSPAWMKQKIYVVDREV